MIFRETTQAIWECLKETYVPSPDEALWKKNAVKFQELWQFPNCMGAIDGKHIQIRVRMSGPHYDKHCSEIP